MSIIKYFYLRFVYLPAPIILRFFRILLVKFCLFLLRLSAFLLKFNNLAVGFFAGMGWGTGGAGGVRGSGTKGGCAGGAGAKNNISHSSIAKVCRGTPRYKTAGGFIWKFL